MIVKRVVAAAGVSGVACVVGLGLLAAPAGASTPTSSAPSARAAACDRAAWESPVQGAPKNFSAGDRGGDYLWHDTHGFHLRITHRSHDRTVYTGVVTASAPMRIDPVRLEKGDVARLSANHRTFTFAFSNYGHIDGVNFHTDCAGSLRVDRLNVGNARLAPNRVYLGDKKTHPKSVPFTVHRRVVHT